ncbi:MAG: hypothetical protein PHU14_02605 [Methylovulum sp.]|nr:hypothetical protein [Methylovulum sp.]
MNAKKYDDVRWLGLCLLLGFGVNAAKAGPSAPWVGTTLAGEPCMGGRMDYGPFDYTNLAHKAKKLPIVEEYHFTKDVQLLIKGNTSTIINDLNYTVTAFPNHHPALDAIMHYQLIYQNDIDAKKKPPVSPPVECYFQRAIRFAPKDPLNYLMYASYLRKIKHPQEAEEVYKQAVQKLPDGPDIKYGYGLFLVEAKRYPEALAQARAIYAKGFRKQKLKDLLLKSGHWQN